MQNIAAIDTGSNVTCMLVGQIFYDAKVGVSLTVRLGQDAFTTGIIS